MTSYEAIEFLEALPRTGMINIQGSDYDLFFVSSTCGYKAVGDSSLLVTGHSGFGSIATVESSVLLDADSIKMIRHTRGTEA